MERINLDEMIVRGALAASVELPGNLFRALLAELKEYRGIAERAGANYAVSDREKLQAEIAGVRERIDEYKGKVTRLEGRIQSLEADSRAYIDQRHEDMKAIETLTTQLAQRDGEVRALKAEREQAWLRFACVGSHEEFLSDLDDLLTNHCLSVNAIADLQAQLRQRDERIAMYGRCASISSSYKIVTELHDELSTMRTQVKAVREKIAALDVNALTQEQTNSVLGYRKALQDIRATLDAVPDGVARGEA